LPNILSCLTQQHDVLLVLIAAAICALGNGVVHALLSMSCDCVEDRRRQWLAVAAVAEGGAVWSTHFVAMLAYRGPMPMRFDVVLTMFSAALPVAFFWLAYRLLGRAARWRAAPGAAVVATAGVLAMHYIGMASLGGDWLIHFAWPQVFAWAAAAACLFTLAFGLFGQLEANARIALPTLAASAAVVVLHFGTMGATTLAPVGMTRAAYATSALWLVPVICVTTLALILTVLVGARVDRLLTDLRGLVDATLEGVAILSEGRVIEANVQLGAMLGRPREELLGSLPEQWLSAEDDLPIATQRARPVEGRLRARIAPAGTQTSADGGLIVEIATHRLEYRGRACLVMAVRDLTERKRAEAAMAYMATHDALTGLGNRSAFDQALAQALTGPPFALLALDLDRFKAVNDLYGHAAGDEVLRKVSDILREAVAPGDYVARIGGDEFAILQRAEADKHNTARDRAEQLGRTILTAFADQMCAVGKTAGVGVSLGIALYPRDGRDADALHNNADIALYRTKRGGRGALCFFDEAMDDGARERKELEQDLRQALARREMFLEYQAMVDPRDNRLCGYEAHLRWRHPRRGLIDPSVFIPLAEDTGAMLAIGEWAMVQACERACQWHRDLTLALKLSPMQLRVADLPARLSAILRNSGLPPRRVEIEIPESAMMQERDEMPARLEAMARLGVRLTISEFGSGHSSLATLQTFAFAKLKIGSNLVDRAMTDRRSRSILRALADLGRDIGMTVAAEGIETEAHRLMILAEGCTVAQGACFDMLGTHALPDATPRTPEERIAQRVPVTQPVANRLPI